jgi:cytochrome c-type biogenesis protein
MGPELLAPPLAQGDPLAVGIPIAFAAGALSFLSPCVLPLVPGYLAAVTGLDLDRMEEAGWRHVLGPSLVFVGVFSAIFIALGVGAVGLGQAFNQNRVLFNQVAGAFIVAMGVLFVASLVFARLNREWRPEALLRRAGRGGPAVAGAAFAVAWTPCVGPALAAILSLASTSDSALRGAGLLAVYSAGLGVPFILTALAYGRATTAFAWVRRRQAALMGAAGAILVVMGVLVFTGELFRLNIEAQRFLNSLGLDVWSEV